MSSLTENERIALDEVFMSISTGHSRKKSDWFKPVGAFFKPSKESHKGPNRVSGLLKNMKNRLKIAYFVYLLPKKQKKKKNLS